MEEAKAEDTADEEGGKTLAGTIHWQGTSTRIQLTCKVRY